ncbi:MAG: hypothetical protein HZC40_14350, partial [Chloroflexi bacterium]|nr:hypothetical protein [Chloroflexota bacterium]
MRKIFLLGFFLVAIIFQQTTYAYDPDLNGGCWGCDSGGGGGGFCDVNPDLCGGGDEEAGIDVQQGGGGYPGPIQNLYQNALNQFGTADCGPGCTAKILPDGSLQIDNKGVVTTWKEVPVGGGGGEDPNPNDSCTPVSKSCTFPACPNTVGSCTYAPCGYVLQESQTCCPAAVKPTKPTNPDPPDGTTDRIL